MVMMQKALHDRRGATRLITAASLKFGRRDTRDLRSVFEMGLKVEVKKNLAWQ